MKSQLLQSCRGCVPSNSKPHPNIEAPSQLYPRGRSSTPTSLNSAGMSSRPLGRDGEGLSGGFGEGPLSVAVLYRRKPDFLNGQRPLFFTVAAAGVMPCMTVVMGPMTRRKTCFPTGIGDSAAKAKPPAVTTAFCIHLIPLIEGTENYRYFHFIGVVRRHYRAFTRRSGNDVW